MYNPGCYAVAIFCQNVAGDTEKVGVEREEKEASHGKK